MRIQTVIFMGLWASSAHAAPFEVGDLPSCRDKAQLGTFEANALGTDASTQGLCLRMGLDVAGRASLLFPSQGISTRMELPRARALFQLQTPYGASVRIALEPVRSGGENGYIGIDGESFVPRFQIAEARWDWNQAGLAVAGGIVDDLWTMSVQDAWGLPQVDFTLGMDQGWLERADVGAWVSWTSPKAFATVTASLTSGEGYRRRERNNGKNATFLATFRPLVWLENPDEGLEISAMYRDGSRGVEVARDHRAAVRASYVHPWAAGGVEALWGWGANGDSSQLPFGVSAWARTGDALPVVGWARVDVAQASRDVEQSQTLGWWAGIGPSFPLKKGATSRPLQILLGYEGAQYQANAQALPGTDTTAVNHRVFLQVGANVQAAFGFRTQDAQ